MINRTIKAAGFDNVMPYHINVPSFGDWGFNIASKNNMDLKKAFHEIDEFSVKLNFLNPEILKASTAFGNNQLSSKDSRINEILNPILPQIYENNSWLNI